MPALKSKQQAATKKPATKRKSATSSKGGRPSRYTKEIARAICERLALGESLRSVCRDETMPGISTVFRWFDEHDGFREHYEKAKQESADALAEELLEIADDGRNDYMEKLSADGEAMGYITNGENIQRSRLRVDTRKWIMARMKPKKYGDKTIHEGGDTPIKVAKITAELPPDEASRLYKELVRGD